MKGNLFLKCEIPLHCYYSGSFPSGMIMIVLDPFMSQIELFNHLTMCKQMTDVKLLVLCGNT